MEQKPLSLEWLPVEYTDGMKTKVRELGIPVKGFRYTIVAFPKFLLVRIYEDNVMQFEDEQRAAIMAFCLKVRHVIQSFGVQCEVEGIKGDAPRPKSGK